MVIEPAKRNPPPSKMGTSSKIPLPKAAPSTRMTPSPKMTPSPAAAKPVSAAPVPRSLSALLSATGLPADKLSASIVSFSRFFSLPLKPELMTAVRRQALAPELAAVSREALALAATAAESKGVGLEPRGLAEYAAAIDPDSGNRQGSGERNPRERKNKHKDAEQNRLLEILNRLPGKDGRRWIVVPFNFTENGRDFRVSLRILSDGDKLPENHTGHLIVDITETQRRWIFSLESARNGMARLTVYLHPHRPAAALESFAGELADILGIPAGQISVVNRDECFPCETECQNDLLRMINETV